MRSFDVRFYLCLEIFVPCFASYINLCLITRQLKKKPHQGRKDQLAEFEAQLHEAEDVITDLRSELGRHGKRWLSKESSDNRNIRLF